MGRRSEVGAVDRARRCRSRSVPQALDVALALSFWLTASCGRSGDVVDDETPVAVGAYALGRSADAGIAAIDSGRDAAGGCVPTEESCDGTDEDCDGFVDERCEPGVELCPEGYNVIVGTGGDDVLVGTAGRDCIVGLGGDDVLEGRQQDDLLIGGRGNDQLDGEQGQDELQGGTGADVLDGGGGMDRIVGGDGNDVIVATNGKDEAFGGECHDVVSGGNAADRLSGGEGADRIVGGRGPNVVNGGPGVDSCAGTDCELPESETPLCADDGDCASPDRCVAAAGVCADPAVIPFEDPTCDGEDEDCDGTADDDYVAPVTRCGVGACAAEGALLCEDGRTRDTCVPGEPAPSDATCDGTDDDCDGVFDEAYDSVATTCGAGACARTGATSCVAGQVQDSCAAGTPSPDTTCDGVDEDCDGVTDEAYAPVATSCGVGACAATGVTSCVAAQGGCVAGANPVSHWSAEGDATDVIGGNDGTLLRGVTFAAGKVGQAFSFDGSVDAYIQLPDAASLFPASGQLTIEAWIKPNFGVNNELDTILTKRDGCDSSGISYLLAVNKGDPNASYGAVVLALSTDFGITAVTSGAVRVPDDGNFHHVAGTFDGLVAKVFLDGILVGQVNRSEPLVITSSAPVISHHGGECGQRADALIDEIAFYDRALGAEEIDTHAALCAAHVRDSCASAAPAFDDTTCDGIDDDCDGAVDEEYPSLPTTCGVGECISTGATSCEAGQVVDSCTPLTPSPDSTCDGVDDDCDGTADEHYVSLQTECGVGPCASTGATACVPGQAGDCVAGADLAGYWPAEGDATDAVGISDGVLEGGASFAAGRLGQAFDLDGFDDFVDLGNDPSLQVSQGDFTAAAWVRFDSFPVIPCGDCPATDTAILDKMSAAGVNQDGWRILRQADGRFWACLGGTDDNHCFDPNYTLFSQAVPTIGRFYHVALVKDETSFTLYIDGVPEDERVLPVFTDTHSTPLLVGRSALDGAFLDGIIDEVQLYARALTAPEIGQLAAGCTLVEDSCTSGTPAPDDATCDGIDDDCDEASDEGYVAPVTSCGVGACVSYGLAMCASGTLVDTCAPGTPAPDDATCDGVDDDCDGTSDEHYVSVGSTCGIGACAADGAVVCLEGQEVDTCTPGEPTPDTNCDLIDDDCDGKLNDEFPSQPTTCGGTGQCAASGYTTCVRDEVFRSPTIVDTCTAPCEGACADGLDDDRDGRLDCYDDDCLHDPVCVFGDACKSDADCAALGTDAFCDLRFPHGYCSLPCGTPGAAECPLGNLCLQQECVAACDASGGCADSALECRALEGVGGFESTTEPFCRPICDPTPAHCDAPCPENECDDAADFCCAAMDQSCDGLDDDCDGTADDDFPSVPTTCGPGACRAEGTLICALGESVDTCSLPCVESACTDGRDDDGDRLTDCDDDDCHGRPECVRVGDACTNDGDCAPLGAGAGCALGLPGGYCTLTCRDDPSACPTGSFCFQNSACFVACDANHECASPDHECQTLSSDPTEICRPTCALPCLLDGRFCDPQDNICHRCLTTDEHCDGVDEDCDSSIDEEFSPAPTTCGIGACAATGTAEACVDGAPVDTCVRGTPAPSDESCDGIDEDCDGVADEDFVAQPTSCDVGSCEARGTTFCDAGVAGDTCVAPAGACEGTCDDGVDNDGNRVVDCQDPACFQDPVCVIGDSCRSDLDCAALGPGAFCDPVLAGSCTLPCVGGHESGPGCPAGLNCHHNKCIQSCAQSQLCPHDDEECTTPLDFDGQLCFAHCPERPCLDGWRCEAESGLCVSACAPTDGTCDGVDDDSDGTNDEGYAPRTDACGVGACAATGLTSCVSGREFSSCTPGQPSPDTTCDAVDDDCDGTADEEYASSCSTCVDGERQPVGVDDGDPCTTDGCDPVTDTATHTPAPAGTSCADGDLCNGPEICGFPCDPAPSGLKNHWPADGDYQDVVGGANATPINGTTFSTGKFGQAFSLPATSAAVLLPNQALNGVGDVTFAVWIRTTDTIAAIVAGANSGQSNEYLLFITAGALQLWVKGAASVAFSAPGLTDNTYHHLVWVRRLSGINEIYMDGVLRGTQTLPTGTLTIGNNGLWLGQEQDCLGDCFDANQALLGSMDEVGLYDRALSATEIGALSEKTLPHCHAALPPEFGCQSGVPLVVDDGNECTVDGCEPATGAVTHAPLSAGVACNDGNACTTDACDGAGSCAGTPLVGTACNDDNACTTEDACDGAGACAGTPLSVDDGDSCTADVCFSNGVITHTRLPAGTPCDNACISGSTCNSSGLCTGGIQLFNDGNQCTADACDPATGITTHTPLAAGATCNDLKVCTTGDACDGAGSCAGTPVAVDDGNMCTTDTCNTSTGVITHAPVAAGTPCDDGNACTLDTVCSSGACGGGTQVGINDGNECTVDACDPATGAITHAPLSAGRCSSSNPDAPSIGAGDRHSCAVVLDGRVRCWGDNGSGQCGDGTSGNDRLTPVYVVGLTDAVMVDGGDDAGFTCALRRTGQVVCWGRGGNGRLGYGGTSNSSVPIAVSGLTDAVYVSAGRSHACAVRANGKVSCWGSGSGGQLGQGTTNGSLVPIEVLGLVLDLARKNAS